MASAQNGKAEEKCLRELFCGFFQCPPEQFEERFLWQCLYSPRLSRLIWRLDRDFFREDLEMIRQLGHTTSYSDCRHEIESSRHENPPLGVLRRTLKIRVSGQEIIKIASKLFLNHQLPLRQTIPTNPSMPAPVEPRPTA
jgi:hypothetical protein